MVSSCQFDQRFIHSDVTRAFGHGLLFGRHSLFSFCRRGIFSLYNSFFLVVSHLFSNWGFLSSGGGLLFLIRWFLRYLLFLKKVFLLGRSLLNLSFAGLLLLMSAFRYLFLLVCCILLRWLLILQLSLLHSFLLHLLEHGNSLVKFLLLVGELSQFFVHVLNLGLALQNLVSGITRFH